MVAEYDAAGTMQQRYVHWVGADVPVVAYSGATLVQPTWLHADQQGSIVALSNGSGIVTAIDTYDEYGIPGAANTGRFQYTGQAWLAELGMYYYKARIYSPTLGRFMQTDPIGYGDQINLYEYVGDDPVDGVDPSGNETGSVACANNACGQSSFSLSINGVADLIDGLTNAALVVETIATFGGSAAGPDEVELGVERAATGALRRMAPEAPVTARQESGIVYRRTNPETGRCYIGRCNSEELFARRQRDHDRILGRRHEYEILERGRSGRPLREAEQRHIDAHGGPTNRSNPHGGTENKRNEMHTCRGTRIGNIGTGSIC